MGATKRKRPVTNEEAVLRLEAAGYDMDQFRLENLKGFYVPLQLWSKYVGKFNPQLKRGWRVELNLESSRKVGRTFNMKEVNEMTASLGIGNGNCYQFDPDDKLEADEGLSRWYSKKICVSKYKQPIKVGNKFITNIIQSHRMYNAKTKQHPAGLFRLTSNIDTGKELLKQCELAGDYSEAMRDWKVNRERIDVKYFQNVVTLEPHGVLRGIKRPYGHISGIYVHFFPTWVTKREARYHVAFDHGANVIITNDWITRSWATTYPEGVTFKECSFEGKHKLCEGCSHTETHIHEETCYKPCLSENHKACDTVMDYREQNMHVVHKGTSFKIPKPVREPVEWIPIEVQHKQLMVRDWMIAKGHVARSEEEVYQMIDSIVEWAGGRIQ